MSRLVVGGFKIEAGKYLRRARVRRLLVAVLMFSASTSFAQSEDQIKAAYLLNFARYVEWPAAAFGSNGTQIKICVVDSAEFASVIAATVSGKSVGDRTLVTESVGRIDDAVTCHILYVGEANSDPAQGAIEKLANQSIFSVADDEGFAKDGGVANFIRAGNKIRFEINPEAARRAGLKISSRLLRLARIVE